MKFRIKKSWRTYVTFAISALVLTGAVFGGLSYLSRATDTHAAEVFGLDLMRDLSVVIGPSAQNIDGPSDNFAITTTDWGVLPQTVTIRASFSSGSLDRKITIQLEEGAKLFSAPGMTGSGRSWSFSSGSLLPPLNSIISSGSYVPTTNSYPLAGGTQVFQPSAGVLEYSFYADDQGGVDNVEFSFQIIGEAQFFPNGGSKTFNNAFTVTSYESSAAIEQSVLEQLTMTGALTGNLFTTQRITVPIGGRYALQNCVYTNQATPSTLFSRITFRWRIPKQLGLPDQFNVNNGNSAQATHFQTIQDIADSSTSVDYNYLTTVVEWPYLQTGRGETCITLSGIVQPTAVPGNNYSILGNKIIWTTYDGIDIESTSNVGNPVVTVTRDDNMLTIASASWSLNRRNTTSTITKLGACNVSNINSFTLEDKRIEVDFSGSPQIQTSIVSAGVGTEQDFTGVDNLVVETNERIISLSHYARALNDTRLQLSQILTAASLATIPGEYIVKIAWDHGPIVSGSRTPTADGWVNYWDSITRQHFGFWGIIADGSANYTLPIRVQVYSFDPGDRENTMTPDFVTPINCATTLTNPARDTMPFNVTSSSYSVAASSSVQITATANVMTHRYGGGSDLFDHKGLMIIFRQPAGVSFGVDDIQVVHNGVTYSTTQNSSGIQFQTGRTDNDGRPVIYAFLPNVMIGIWQPGTTIRLMAHADPDAQTLATPIRDIIMVVGANSLGGDDFIAASYNTTRRPDNLGVTSVGPSLYLGAPTASNVLSTIRSSSFMVSTAASRTENGPYWVSFNPATGQSVINLTEGMQGLYRVNVSNQTGSAITGGYTAFVPIPKQGEKAIYREGQPDEVVLIDPATSSGDGTFAWSASLHGDVESELTDQGFGLDYTVMYAVDYLYNTDNTGWYDFASIPGGDLSEVKMVRIAYTGTMPADYNTAPYFTLDIAEDNADDLVGEINIYSSLIYRSISGSDWYGKSLPVAMRLQTGVVSGTVWLDNDADNDGDAPFPSILVRAYEAGTPNLIETTSTNTEGNYIFTSLDRLVDVDIEFENPGYSTDTYRFLYNDGMNPVSTLAQRYFKITDITPTYTGLDAILTTPMAVTFSAPASTVKPDNQGVFKGDTPTRPTTDPTLTGYTFDNYYSDSGLTTLFDFGAAIFAPTTIYIKMTANPYTLTFDVGDGTAPDGITMSITQNFGTTISQSAIDLRAPTPPTDYSFEFWRLDDPETGTILTGPFTVSNNRTAYAVYQLLGLDYTVDYDITIPTLGPVTACVTFSVTIGSIDDTGWAPKAGDTTGRVFCKSYSTNISESVPFTDAFARDSTFDVEITNIRTAPTATFAYSETAPTLSNVTVTMTADREINTPAGWTDTGDHINFTLVVTANTGGLVTVNLLDFENIPGTAQYQVENIRTPLTADVTYSELNPTNEEVIAYITPNRPIITPSGWTRVTATLFSKSYPANATEVVPLEDFEGFTTSVTITIENIFRWHFDPNGDKSGRNEAHTLSTGSNIIFVIDRPFALFTGDVEVNGILLDPSIYTAHEGSTVITLLPDHLATLGTGFHLIGVHFSDGVEIADWFEVLPRGVTPPGTGSSAPADFSARTAATLTAVLSGTIISSGLLVIYFKRRKHRARA